MIPLSPRQISEWLAYHATNTVADERDDFRAALIAYVVNRTMGGKVKFDHLRPFDRPRRPKQSPEDHKARMRQWARVQNASRAH